MRSSSREMSWEENRQSFVQEADEGSVICRWNDSFPMRYPAPKNPTENICRRRVPFEMKFWLSAVGGFQITKTLTEIAGNRWLKSCMMIRYAVYTPIQKGRIRTHWGKNRGRHSKFTQTLCKIIWAIIYLESLRRADEWFMGIVSASSRWNQSILFLDERYLITVDCWDILKMQKLLMVRNIKFLD